MGTLGTVPCPSLLVWRFRRAAQPPMAPSGARVVLTLEWLLAVPRRGGRPRLRSLGPVLASCFPLSAPKLQMGRRAASTARPRPANVARRNGLAPIFAFASQTLASTQKNFNGAGRAAILHLPTGRAPSRRVWVESALQISSPGVLSADFDTSQPDHRPGVTERDLSLPRTAALAQGRHLCQVGAAWRGGHARAPSWSSLFRDPGWH